MHVRGRVRPFHQHRLIAEHFEERPVGRSRFEVRRREHRPAGAQLVVPLAFPSEQFGIQLGHGRIEFALPLRNVLFQPLLPLRLLFGRQLQKWIGIRFVPIHHRLVQVVEQGVKPVILPVRDRIVLVGVAAGARHC